MKLLTKELEKKLPGFYETENIPTEDKIVVVRYFDPFSHWTWYGVEYDPKDRVFFGYVIGLDKEWGYFALDELESYKGPYGLGIERDICFKPASMGEILKDYI